MRERDREIGGQGYINKDRASDKETERVRDRERESYGDKDTKTKRELARHRETERDRDRDRPSERQKSRDRETEREKERKGDRDSECGRSREICYGIHKYFNPFSVHMLLFLQCDCKTMYSRVHKMILVHCLVIRMCSV